MRLMNLGVELLRTGDLKGSGQVDRTRLQLDTVHRGTGMGLERRPSAALDVLLERLEVLEQHVRSQRGAS